MSTKNIYSVTFVWKISNQKSNDVPLDKLFVIFVGHYFLCDGWHCILFFVVLFVFILSLIYHNKNDWLFLILDVFYIWSQAETLICISITFVYQIICFAYILQHQFMFYFCVLFLHFIFFYVLCSFIFCIFSLLFSFIFFCFISMLIKSYNGHKTYQTSNVC